MMVDATNMSAPGTRGVQRVEQWLPSGPRPRVEAALEKWEAAIAEYNPE